jgi:hypothetical protein
MLRFDFLHEHRDLELYLSLAGGDMHPEVIPFPPKVGLRVFLEYKLREIMEVIFQPIFHPLVNK